MPIPEEVLDRFIKTGLTMSSMNPNIGSEKVGLDATQPVSSKVGTIPSEQLTRIEYLLNVINDRMFSKNAVKNNFLMFFIVQCIMELQNSFYTFP